MADYLFKRSRHDYDNFFDHNQLKNETSYFHYFLPERGKPTKIVMKCYESDGKTYEKNEFLIPTARMIEPEKPSFMFEEDRVEVPEPSLLEVPIPS